MSEDNHGFSVKAQLANFIEHAMNVRMGARQWLEDDRMKVYVRKGFHLIDGRVRLTLDATDINKWVRARVAVNPNTPHDVRTRLMGLLSDGSG